MAMGDLEFVRPRLGFLFSGSTEEEEEDSESRRGLRDGFSPGFSFRMGGVTLGGGSRGPEGSVIFAASQLSAD